MSEAASLCLAWRRPRQAPAGVVYRERRPPRTPAWQRHARGWLAQILARSAVLEPAFLAAVRAAELDSSGALEDGDGLRAAARRARQRHDEAALARVFGAAGAAVTAALGLRYHDVQLIAARELFRGRLVEMATGEGKTLAACPAAATAALAGMPVHVVTSNDYLAARDAAELAPVYARLGLSCGAITEGMTPLERRDIYRRDVVYCSSKELGFDYLKDRIALRSLESPLRARLRGLRIGGRIEDQLLLRGLGFVIVDEADSVLIDEARTPLIISAGQQAAGEQGRVFEEAISLARQLEPATDTLPDESGRGRVLSREGSARLADLCAGYDGVWQGPRRREALINQALVALYAFQRDHHYLVRDDTIQIIDEHSGRVHPDRAWEHGLQQLIEAREGVTITAPREVLARISYQRFFSRFEHLCGMSGTVRAAAAEFGRTYGLRTVCIPTHRPVRRVFGGTLVCRGRGDALARLVGRVAALNRDLRPVLIGTRSVAASELVSEALTAAAIEHRVLNAKQDRDEAEVIAAAGQPGAITVATSMAGRGTDIRLGEGVAERGGLHVICVELHDAARIDQQLQGRTARQGEPGSFEVILSADDALVDTVPAFLRALAGRPPIGAAIARVAQRRVEAEHARARRILETMDERIHDMLAFAGSAR